MDLKKILHSIFLSSPLNYFDAFILECMKWYAVPAHSLTEMRRRENKKIRGDIFEEFCVLYLQAIQKYKVWRLENVPASILETLNMKRRDMGIDLIVEHEDGSFSAVQCKYKKPTFKKNSVSWKSLSTFYALCLRTGKMTDGKRIWNKFIIMTNCDYVRHQGEKTEQDISICLQSFRNIQSQQWFAMCEIDGFTLEENKSQDIDFKLEDLRSLRLAFYDKKK